jgi:hypothetical protein
VCAVFGADAAADAGQAGGMTAQEIVEKLFRPVDKERIQKAQGLAARSRIEWSVVLAAMTPEQRQQVQDAQA